MYEGETQRYFFGGIRLPSRCRRLDGRSKYMMLLTRSMRGPWLFLTHACVLNYGVTVNATVQNCNINQFDHSRSLSRDESGRWRGKESLRPTDDGKDKKKGLVSFRGTFI